MNLNNTLNIIKKSLSLTSNVYPSITESSLVGVAVGGVPVHLGFVDSFFSLKLKNKLQCLIHYTYIKQHKPGWSDETVDHCQYTFLPLIQKFVLITKDMNMTFKNLISIYIFHSTLEILSVYCFLNISWTIIIV